MVGASRASWVSGKSGASVMVMRAALSMGRFERRQPWPRRWQRQRQGEDSSQGMQALAWCCEAAEQWSTYLRGVRRRLGGGQRRVRCARRSGRVTDAEAQAIPGTAEAHEGLSGRRRQTTTDRVSAPFGDIARREDQGAVAELGEPSDAAQHRTEDGQRHHSGTAIGVRCSQSEAREQRQQDTNEHEDRKDKGHNDEREERAYPGRQAE